MKKILAFAFAATMVSFAACTSKPTEEAETETVIEETVVEPVIEAEADTLASDTVEQVEAPAN